MSSLYRVPHSLTFQVAAYAQQINCKQRRMSDLKTANLTLIGL